MGKHIHGHELKYDFGTFDGGHWPYEYQSFDDPVASQDVVDWDTITDGGAEFWPSGDKEEIALLFEGATERGQERVSKVELIHLANLLDHLGGDSLENYLRIRHAMKAREMGVGRVSTELLDSTVAHIFVGDDLGEVRRRAAAAMEAHYQPKTWSVEGEETSDTLTMIQRSPAWTFEEITVADKVAVTIAPKPKVWSATK